MALNAPPLRSPIMDGMGNVALPWSKWFQEVYARIGESLGRATTAIDADVSTLSEDSASVSSRITAVEAEALSQGSRITFLEAGPVAPEFTVTDAPDAAGHAGKMIFVTNEVGGQVLAFSDGTSWRRVTDRAVIS